jgi:hypothetical protein
LPAALSSTRNWANWPRADRDRLGGVGAPYYLSRRNYLPGQLVGSQEKTLLKFKKILAHSMVTVIVVSSLAQKCCFLFSSEAPLCLFGPGPVTVGFQSYNHWQITILDPSIAQSFKFMFPMGTWKLLFYITTFVSVLCSNSWFSFLIQLE